MENKKNPQKKKRRTLYQILTRSDRDGPGVEKEPVGPPDLENFFRLYGRQIGNVAKINLLTVFGNFPIFFALYAMTGYLNHNAPAPASSLFAPLYGAMTASPDSVNPVTALLYGIHGVQAEASVLSTATEVFFLLALLVVFTFGFVNVGTSYLLRNIVRHEPIFFWSDFFYAVKRNLKQALIYGIIDCGIIAVLAYNIINSYFNLGNMVVNIVFFSNILLAFLFFVMRFYIYIMMVTFDLSIFKLLKNALILALLGFKRNALAVTGIGLAMAFTYAFLIYFQPIGILLPFTLLFGTGALMGAYAAYPKIKEIMIDPYYKSDRPYSEPVAPTENEE